MNNLKIFFIVLLLLQLTGCTKNQNENTMSGKSDSLFIKLSDEFIKGYLAWRPQYGTSLGLHEYDGKLTDYSLESVNGEINRLKKFEKELLAIDTLSLSPKVHYDYKILLNSIKGDIFDFEVRDGYRKNPMSYAGVIGVDIYIKRNFAPLEDRLKSIISIEKEAVKVYENARKNLNDSLPKSYVETAILMAKGTSDFLGKDLLLAFMDVKDGKLMSEFKGTNEKSHQ